MKRKRISNYTKALLNGCFNYNRKPYLFKVALLENFIAANHLKIGYLCREIAYSMVFPYSKRAGKVWQLVKASTNFNDQTAKNLCVFYTGESPEIRDIILVDFSILEGPLKDSFLQDNPTVKVFLLQELKRWES